MCFLHNLDITHVAVLLLLNKTTRIPLSPRLHQRVAVNSPHTASQHPSSLLNLVDHSVLPPVHPANLRPSLSKSLTVRISSLVLPSLPVFLMVSISHAIIGFGLCNRRGALSLPLTPHTPSAQPVFSLIVVLIVSVDVSSYLPHSLRPCRASHCRVYAGLPRDTRSIAPGRRLRWPMDAAPGDFAGGPCI